MPLLPLVAMTLSPAMARSAMTIPAEYVGRTILNKPAVEEKVVALTFDDGPSPFTTPKVLDALEKHQAKATFFIVGQMVRHREKILERIVADGNAIGNHTHRHAYHPDEATAKDELRFCNQAIYRVVGFYPTLFRPPGGVQDSWTARLAKSEGMASIIWTGSSADTATTSPEVVYKNVIAAARPGAIILMHDVKEHTAAAVPAILDKLQKEGYRCVTVPEMLRIWDAAHRKAEAAKLAMKDKAAGRTSG